MYENGYKRGRENMRSNGSWVGLALTQRSDVRWSETITELDKKRSTLSFICDINRLLIGFSNVPR